MISDSTPWKEMLLRSADVLERRKTQLRWTERTSFLVERDVMLGCYAIRKLHEARKISDELVARRWKVTRHSLMGVPPDRWGVFKPGEQYDFDSGKAATFPFTELCNQVIHSWVWLIAMTETTHGLAGMFVSSERHRGRGLYFIHIDEVILLFREVGWDDIVDSIMHRDANGEMQYIRASSVLDDDETDALPWPPSGQG